ncbi:hypothetical protein [Zhongshania aliphaticivorans]|uniref:hypothetical protein n=1 Tax=Zhongshania aliphaticivorans TaxID=1470434 RepID=UPI0012E40D5C|nr:hypothetical protein [Zhongshania aliphaticivorans]CAA0107950.1 Uncharacterised protein [Zhongshania aliphaticivorans]
MNVNLDAPSVLAIAVNLFKTCLLDVGRTEAKRYFKELEAGRELYLTEMAMPDKSKLRVRLQLMPQEFNGHLNFSAFKLQVQMLCAEIAKVIKAEAEPIVMSDDSGRQLMFNIPAISHIDGDFNALVLGADLRRAGELVLQLMFIDPEQYRQKEQISAEV